MVNKILRNRTYCENSKTYRTVMLGWDNSARRKNGFTVFDNFDLGKYYEWLRSSVIDTKLRFQQQERFVFINAWNEWGEGTYLEPDKKYGYANLNVTSLAIQDKNFEIEIKKSCFEKPKIAVQVHVFYDDILHEILKYTNNITEPFDLYISTDSIKKFNKIVPELKQNSNAENIYIMITENRGRDVAPFLLQMYDKINHYSFFLHLHTKRSLHGPYGDFWRKDMLNKLLGSSERCKNIIQCFKNDSNLGLIYPKPINFLKNCMNIGGNSISLAILGQLLNIQFNEEVSHFPAGNMLWGRVESFKQLFQFPFKLYLFPPEKKQLDGTIMHAIERSWIQIAEYNGYTYKEIE